MKNLKLLFFAVVIIGTAFNTPALLHSPFFIIGSLGLLASVHLAPVNFSLGLMPTAIVNTNEWRWAYNNINNTTAMLNLCFDRNIIVMPDYFRSEQVINNNDSEYTFQTWDKVMQTTIGQFPLQKGVKDNDVFIGLTRNLYMDARVTIGATETGKSNIKLQTYPNPFQFNAANTGNFDDLWSLYNAKFSYKVQNTTFIQDETTSDMCFVPRTQQSIPNGAFQNWSEFDGAKTVVMNPYIAMSGRADNTLTLKFQKYAGWAGGATGDNNQNVLTFFFRGLTCSNAEGFVEYYTGQLNIMDEVAAQVKAGKILLDANGVYRKVGGAS